MKNITTKFIISAILAVSPIIMYAQQPAPSVQDLQAIIRQLQEQMKALQSQVGGLRTELEEVKIELKLTRSLQKGAKGEDVEQLQAFLKRFPDIYPDGLVTGFYGQKTEEAVRKYQQKQGLEPIGVVGPRTREKLQNEAERINKEVTPTPSGTLPAQPATRAVPGESPAIPAERAIPSQFQTEQPPTVSSDLWAGEQVKCVFKGSTSAQKCYSYAKYGGTFTCEGTDACVTDVKGYLGEQLTWKSSCGGYAYTKIDGSNDYAEFDCGAIVQPTQPSPPPSANDPTMYEQVKCVFKGSTAVQECVGNASYGGQFACKGVDACVADSKGYKGEHLAWKSSCGGYAYSLMDGLNESIEFACVSSVQPAITVFSPNGGETFAIGAPIGVKWQTQGIPSSNPVSIGLRNVDTGYDYSLGNDVNDGYAADLIISSSVPAGKYLLFVKTLVNNQSIIDWSDGPFSIIAASSASASGGAPLSAGSSSGGGGSVGSTNYPGFFIKTDKASYTIDETAVVYLSRADGDIKYYNVDFYAISKNTGVQTLLVMNLPVGQDRTLRIQFSSYPIFTNGGAGEYIFATCPTGCKYGYDSNTNSAGISIISAASGGGGSSALINQLQYQLAQIAFAINLLLKR